MEAHTCHTSTLYYQTTNGKAYIAIVIHICCDFFPNTATVEVAIVMDHS